MKYLLPNLCVLEIKYSDQLHWAKVPFQILKLSRNLKPNVLILLFSRFKQLISFGRNPDQSLSRNYKKQLLSYLPIGENCTLIVAIFLSGIVALETVSHCVFWLWMIWYNLVIFMVLVIYFSHMVIRTTKVRWTSMPCTLNNFSRNKFSWF